MAKKKKVFSAPIHETSNYFPSLEIGLQNNYIYYKSLLYGDDERFQMNRVIGEEAQNYLDNIHDIKLNNPASDNSDNQSAVTKALNLLFIAYNNERTKEMKWLAEVCEALGIEFDPNTEDYFDIIQILNEVQKGADDALAAIKSEAARWHGIDIERVLNSKKLQHKYESMAKLAERKGNKVDAEYYHKQGEDLYWGTKGRSGRGDNSLVPIARAIGEIDQRANKLFTGSGRSAAAHLEKILLPYVRQAIIFYKGGDVKFDLNIMQSALRELLDLILSELVTDEILGKFTPSARKNNNDKAPSFLNATNAVREKYTKEYISQMGEENLIEKAKTVLLTNGYLDSLELASPTETQQQLHKELKSADKEADRVIQKILKNLAQDRALQQEFLATQHKDINKTVTAKNKKFMDFLTTKFHLTETITPETVKAATAAGVRQRYYYSEERTLEEVKHQIFDELSPVMRGQGYRPKGNPKTDAILGYLTYEFDFDNTNIKKQQSLVLDMKDSIEKAQKDTDEMLRKAVDGQYAASSKLNLKRTASVESYTQNAQIFEQIRQQQLMRLEALASEIAKQKEQADAIFTKYNVMTTVKDQNGLLDTFTPNNNKLRERGIGFSGGAMGTNDSGLSALDNIVALGKKGGIIEDVDVEWLKFALLNSGLGLMGYRNRSSLENYFSLFASYLMFDDAQNIITDAITENAQEIGTKNTVQNIHLYVINGVYLPQSYILYELYTRMTETMLGSDFHHRNLSQGTVRTQIYSYNVGSKYPGNTEQDWQNEASTAADTIKIKMYFLMNFSNLVQQLYERIGT